jgi:tetrahydromethanopterin S-methyltransferase subunit G
MEDTDFDFLCNGLSAEEAKRMRKILAEWSDGDENGFPVQLVMLTRAQWRAAALVPQAVNESRKLIELHLAEYRRQTAALIGNLSAVGEEQTGELNNIFKAHTEALNHASGSFRSQLKEIGAAAMDIRRHLDDGVSAHHRVKNELKAASEKFQKTCAELDNRISGLQIRRDWLALFGLIAIGIVIGGVVGIVIAFKYR